MRKTPALCVILMASCIGAYSQATFFQDACAFYSYGIAGVDQIMAPTGEPGIFREQENGYNVNTGFGFKANVAYVYDLYVKLIARSRMGSPYQELQLTPASYDSFSLSVDSLYGKIDIFNGLKLNLPIGLYLTAGKFQAAAANYGKVSLYGMDSALNMIKLKTDVNVGLDVSYTFGVLEQMLETTYSSITLQAYTGGRFDDMIQRLYDTNGVNDHGNVVPASFDWQIFAALKLNSLVLPFGTLSAEADYMYNGAGIYSGNSFGASVLLTPTLVKPREVSEDSYETPTPMSQAMLTLPVGLGFAFYDKNIDALAGNVSPDVGLGTIDFRNTIRAAASVGARFLIEYVAAADLTLSGTYTLVNHFWRSPISIFGASADAKFTWQEKYFIGGGVIFGTLTDVTWQSTADAPSAEDYLHTFTLPQNMGWEAYLGITIGKAVITAGVNNNKGLSMNYGLESLKDGEMKYRQPGTTDDQKLWETFGIFLKATLKI